MPQSFVTQEPRREEPRPLLLIVDDDAVVATVLGSLLRGDGYDVVVESDSAAAIERLSRAPLPDALITDLHMPGPDGIEVSRQAQVQRMELPIFVLTGDPGSIARSSGLSSRVEVVSKPVDYARLVRRLHAIVPVSP